MLQFKKNRLIKEKINTYLDTVDQCLQHFSKAIQDYCQSPHPPTLAQEYPVVHAFESKADDLRRAIEGELYTKSLLPESRKDLLLLIDAVDHLPNRAEAVIRAITCQQLTLPTPLLEPLQQIAEIAHTNSKLVTQAARTTIETGSPIAQLICEIDKNESLSDKIEQQTIRHIFTENYSDLQRILFRDLFLDLGNLVDMTERVSDHITIFNIKRQV